MPFFWCFCVKYINCFHVLCPWVVNSVLNLAKNTPNAAEIYPFGNSSSIHFFAFSDRLLHYTVDDVRKRREGDCFDWFHIQWTANANIFEWSLYCASPLHSYWFSDWLECFPAKKLSAVVTATGWVEKTKCCRIFYLNFLSSKVGLRVTKKKTAWGNFWKKNSRGRKFLILCKILHLWFKPPFVYCSSPLFFKSATFSFFSLSGYFSPQNWTGAPGQTRSSDWKCLAVWWWRILLSSRSPQRPCLCPIWIANRQRTRSPTKRFGSFNRRSTIEIVRRTGVCRWINKRVWWPPSMPMKILSFVRRRRRKRMKFTTAMQSERPSRTFIKLPAINLANNRRPFFCVVTRRPLPLWNGSKKNKLTRRDSARNRCFLPRKEQPTILLIDIRQPCWSVKFEARDATRQVQ